MAVFEFEVRQGNRCVTTSVIAKTKSKAIKEHMKHIDEILKNHEFDITKDFSLVVKGGTL